VPLALQSYKREEKAKQRPKGKTESCRYLFHQFICIIDSAQGISLQLPKHVAALSA